MFISTLLLWFLDECRGGGLGEGGSPGLHRGSGRELISSSCVRPTSCCSGPDTGTNIRNADTHTHKKSLQSLKLYLQIL